MNIPPPGVLKTKQEIDFYWDIAWKNPKFREFMQKHLGQNGLDCEHDEEFKRQFILSWNKYLTSKMN